MNIALMSHDNKKDLMVQFCTAYAGILSQHHLYATNTTGHMVAEATWPAIAPISPACATRTTSPSPATSPPPRCWCWAWPGAIWTGGASSIPLPAPLLDFSGKSA